MRLLLPSLLLACGGKSADTSTAEPSAVQPDWLVLGEPSPCEAPADAPRYVDVAEEWGLGGIHSEDSPHAGGAGVAVADLDGDEDLDVALAYVTAPAQVFWRDGDAYTPGPALASGESGATGFGLADSDGDGDLDVGVTGATTRVAWNENQGDGRFVDVTPATLGELSPSYGYTAPIAADWDRDGDVDLALPVRMPGGRSRGDRLYDNDGAGVFTDISAEALPETEGALTFQGLFFDANNDLYPELYAINDQGSVFGGNGFFQNEAGGRFTSGADRCGCAPVVGGMSGTAGDVNRDGYLDLFLGNSDACNLMINDGAGRFYDGAAVAGVQEVVAEGDPDMVWGSMLFDHDNDGDLDILAVHGDLISEMEPREPLALADALLSQQPDGTFTDIAPDLGLDALDSGRSVVVDHWNDDGVLDILVTVINDWPHLYLSQTCTAGAWVALRLQGPPGNPFGLGARVEVEAGGQTFLAEATHGSGLNAARDSRVHIGLGEADTIEALRVFWPDGTVSETDFAFSARRAVTVAWAP